MPCSKHQNKLKLEISDKPKPKLQPGTKLSKIMFMMKPQVNNLKTIRIIWVRCMELLTSKSKWKGLIRDLVMEECKEIQRKLPSNQIWLVNKSTLLQK